MTKVKTLAEVQKELQAKVDKGNKALSNKSELTHTFLAGFTELEKEYAKLMAHNVYNELKKHDLPMVEASKKFSYTVMRKVEVKKDGIITELRLETSERQIDPLKFCEHGNGKSKLNTMWQYEAAALCYVMSIVSAQDLGYSELELATVDKCYSMQREARAIIEQSKSAKNPKVAVSNKTLVKRLQQVIDAILPPADEAKGNVYKVNNYHIAFILKGFTKLSRKPATISVAKESYFRSLLFHIMHCLTTGKRCGLDGYRLAKNEQYYVPPTVIPAEPMADVESSSSFEDDDLGDTSWLKEEAPKAA